MCSLIAQRPELAGFLWFCGMIAFACYIEWYAYKAGYKAGVDAMPPYRR